MKISDLIKMGLRNLRRRKARTILTVVGVIISTVSIMGVLSLNKGMDERFNAMVKENGSLSLITVSSWAAEFDKDGNYIDGKEQKLNDELVEKLKMIEHVRTVSPYRYFWECNLTSGKYEGYLTLVLMDFDSWEVFGYPPLEDGTYPTKEDYKTFLIGKQAINDFYMWSGRTSKTKTIDLSKDKVNLNFQGYTVQKGKKKLDVKINENYKYIDSPDYSEFQYNVYVDIDYFKELYTTYAKSLTTTDRKKALESLNAYEMIYLNVDNIDNVVPVQEEIEKLGYKSESEMSGIVPIQNASNMMQMVLLVIGGVSVAVSAINIANTMIMSIYERTKEIGVMKVLGCLVSDIKKLFLFEAGLIGLIGGLVGVGLSFGLSWLLNTYGGNVFSFLSIDGALDSIEGSISVIPFWLPILGTFFGMTVGVLSGYFPARRATRISAIEAMKTEG